MERIIHHQPGSVLNVMELTLPNGLIGNPHYNVDRDEVVFILSGSLEALFFDQDLKLKRSQIIVAQNKNLAWIIIPQNTIHQFNVISGEAIIIEIIGGAFFEGACIDVL